MASQLAVDKVRDMSISLEGKGDDEKKDLLKKCAMTTLNSKLVRGGRGRDQGGESVVSRRRRNGGPKGNKRRTGVGDWGTTLDLKLLGGQRGGGA